MQWNWNKLGAEVESARRACVPIGRPGHEEAAARFHRAVAAAWPPGFFALLARCRGGDPAPLDDVLDFIEACPRFFRTGYALDKAVRWVRRPPRTPTQTERMREIVVAAVGCRLRVPFRGVPSLACEVVSPGLRSRIRALSESSTPLVRSRAIMVLDRMEPRGGVAR
jgi:hypothetical protein